MQYCELNLNEILYVLENARICRLCVCQNNQPYCVPTYYAYERSASGIIVTIEVPDIGLKMAMIKANPKVALEWEISDCHCCYTVTSFGLAKIITPSTACPQALCYQFNCTGFIPTPSSTSSSSMTVCKKSCVCYNAYKRPSPGACDTYPCTGASTGSSSGASSPNLCSCASTGTGSAGGAGGSSGGSASGPGCKGCGCKCGGCGNCGGCCGCCKCNIPNCPPEGQCHCENEECSKISICITKITGRKYNYCNC